MAPRKSVHPPISASKIRSMNGITFTLDLKPTATAGVSPSPYALEFCIRNVTSKDLAARWKKPYTIPSKSLKPKPTKHNDLSSVPDLLPRPRRTYIPSTHSTFASRLPSSSLQFKPSHSTSTPKPPSNNLQAQRTITHSTSRPGTCLTCGARKTGQWRRGPQGPRTLCNACGLEFAKRVKKLQKVKGYSQEKAEDVVRKEWEAEKGSPGTFSRSESSSSDSEDVVVKLPKSTKRKAALSADVDEVETKHTTKKVVLSTPSKSSATSPTPILTSSPNHSTPPESQPASPTIDRRGSSSSALSDTSSLSSASEPTTPPPTSAPHPVPEVMGTGMDVGIDGLKRYDAVRSVWV
ncbi:hypothetical protein HK097_010450 [Rhizophlyctis rosea]|uniref:GATA-type domain-containing protein n=1 Tax=Rhizophlyctis rosea TaxID=64517 RepID=A0AAD5S950_9FUNG|nr:hypothetical protein HK097_010450 [Rhizophlyctis rosea]